MSNVNISAPKNNYEGKFSTNVLGKCVFETFASWIENDGHRDIYYSKKILIYFESVEVRILAEKWNIYEAHIFPMSLVQTCWLETTTLCLHTRLSVKNISNSHTFYCNLGNRLTLMCSPPNDKCYIS